MSSSAEPSAIRVFLLDDHEVVRLGVADVLSRQPDITVVGEGGTAAEALCRVPALRPDVAVLDVRLPDGDGVSVCRDLRAQLPDLGVVMLTSYSDDEALFQAIMAGAAGYLLKEIRGRDLVTAVRTVAAGGSLLDPTATAAVLARMRRGAEPVGPLAGLSDQERTVLDLIGEGLTNRQIGEQMFLAEKTVKKYVSHLLAKLGMVRRTQVAILSTELKAPRTEPVPGVRNRSDLHRGVPAQAGPAVGQGHDRGRARPAASPLLEVPQPTARRPLVHAPAVVDDLHDDVLADVEGDRHSARMRVTHGVADALAHDGLHVGGQVAGHQAVDRTRHADGGPEIGAGGPGDDVEQTAAEAVPVPRIVRGVQVEDGGADVPHGLVELFHGRPDLVGGLRVPDVGERALQAQAGGEDPLDHVVVEVARDPVTVISHIGPADRLLPGGQVQGQRGLVGEGADERGERGIERR